MFVVRLARIGIDHLEGQTIDLRIVEGGKDGAEGDRIGDEGRREHFATARGHADATAIGNSESFGVERVDLDVHPCGCKAPENVGFRCTRLSVPLSRSAASGEEDKGVVFAGGFGQCGGRFEVEACASVRVEELAVGEESSF